MTRRQLLLAASAAAGVGCERTDPGLLAHLKAICDAGEFAIVGARLVVDHDDSLVPEAVTASGTAFGELQLPGSPQPHLFSLAPDCAWIAWVPESYLPDAAGKGGEPVFCFTDDIKAPRTSRFDAWFCERIAISSGAKHVAVVAVDRHLVRRLLVLKSATGETEADLTGLVVGFELKHVERLRFSASGERLAVGSTSRFSVLDVPTGRSLFDGEGRFPSLSLNGEEVAFVDGRRNLAIVTVGSGKKRIMLDGATTYGLGSWVPDSSLLLGGVGGPFSFFWDLAVIDCLTDRYAEIIRLEEHDFGQGSMLIKRRLLSQFHG